MCIGVPMQVISITDLVACCEADGKQQDVDISLVGEQAPGTWLLVFLGVAREVIESRRAQQVQDALQALDHVMSGSDQIDHLFADLVDREPPLPDFLKAMVPTDNTKDDAAITTDNPQNEIAEASTRKPNSLSTQLTSGN
jgi:hydrogenase expression/formation protein HypC